MHLAAARDVERIRALLRHMQGDILEELALQAVAQIAGRDVLALLARERRIVDGERHLDGRVGDLHEGQRLHLLRRTDRAADGDVRHAGERDDLACPCLLNGIFAEAVELIERDDLALSGVAGIVIVADGDLLIDADGTALDAADADTADIVVIVDRGDEHLHGRRGVALRRGNIVDDGIEQRVEIHARLVRRVAGDALPRGAEQRRRFELLVRGVQVEQQLKHLVHDLLDAGIETVDLIDNDNDLVTQLQRLLQHEAGLRHGALRRIDEQQNAVDHLEDTLDLAAEIGVARGIDDVDFRSLIMHGGILGQNGNAALTLQIARVHHAVHHGLVLAVDAALLEHFIDQRRLAMVNVCDDGDISNVFLIRHGRQSLLFCIRSRAATHDSARAFGGRFFVETRFEKCRCTLCTSSFSNRWIGEKYPAKVEAAIVRCCPKDFLSTK